MKYQLLTYFVGIAVPSTSIILHSLRSLHFPFLEFSPSPTVSTTRAVLAHPAARVVYDS